MRIGILGGTGPAGTGLAARLASVGYPVVIGSRSKYRAMEAADEVNLRWPDLEIPIEASDNPGAAECDLIVLATPWDSAATTARDLEAHLRGKIVVSMANVGRWRAMCKRRCRRVESWPRSIICRPRSWGTSDIRLIRMS
jgi:8-hydroxy-5-deazaflavin:NADPH oxidoreductase